MRAERRDALGACVLNAQQATAIRMPGRILDFDGFAAECAGHIDRCAAIGDHTVAALADMIDDQTFNHDARR
jgi:hypothetical protein